MSEDIKDPTVDLSSISENDMENILASLDISPETLKEHSNTISLPNNDVNISPELLASPDENEKRETKLVADTFLHKDAVQKTLFNKKLLEPKALSPEDVDKHFQVLYKTITALQEKVDVLTDNKLEKELQLPANLSESLTSLHKESKPLAKPYTRKNRRPLLESDIKDALNRTPSLTEAAKYLNVHIDTFRRYTKMYGLYDLSKKKVRWKVDPENSRYPLSRILAGDFPNYPPYRLKNLLFRAKYKEIKCEMCGFSKIRKDDKKFPLLLYYLDGNVKNHKLENLKIYCYNCAFLSNHINIKVATRRAFNDPDVLQGAQSEYRSGVFDRPVQ